MSEEPVHPELEAIMEVHRRKLLGEAEARLRATMGQLADRFGEIARRPEGLAVPTRDTEESREAALNANVLISQMIDEMRELSLPPDEGIVDHLRRTEEPGPAGT